MMSLLGRQFLLLLWLSAGAIAEPGIGSTIVNSARKQVGVTTSYDPAYVTLSFPGGDLPQDRGVCTDVVVRALRDALKLDLQKAVHEDMKRNFGQYPKIWGLKSTDRNIDHRRVPNLQTYFRRQHHSFKISDDTSAYQPGDLVTSLLPGNLPHIMVVSDQKDESGIPLVIHNIGSGVKEENALLRYPLTGHYRIKKSAQ